MHNLIKKSFAQGYQDIQYIKKCLLTVFRTAPTYCQDEIEYNSAGKHVSFKSKITIMKLHQDSIVTQHHPPPDIPPMDWADYVKLKKKL